MLATDSLQHPLCSDTLLSKSCREEFIMKKSFVQSPVCSHSTEVFAYSARGAQAPGACTESPHPSSVLPAAKNKQQKLHEPALCSTNPYKTFVFLSKKAFQELYTHTTLAAHTEHFPSLTLLPRCTFARVLTAPWETNFTFSASFAHTSATLAGAACVIQDSRWGSRLREADEARIQGGKDESLQNSFLSRTEPSQALSHWGRALPSPE